jgi:hypothetical protein
MVRIGMRSARHPLQRWNLDDDGVRLGFKLDCSVQEMTPLLVADLTLLGVGRRGREAIETTPQNRLGAIHFSAAIPHCESNDHHFEKATSVAK